jgi:N12 class adenine-specific DNA methylase
MIRSVVGAAVALSVAAPAGAQTLNVMRSVDAPHYDAQRTTWAPTSDIVNMVQDTAAHALRQHLLQGAGSWFLVFRTASLRLAHAS